MKYVRNLVLVTLGIICCAVGLVFVSTLYEDYNKNANENTGETIVEYEPEPEPEPGPEPEPEPKTATFHFNGVGDNLLHDPIFLYFEQDNGHRDFSEIYENTKKYSESADLAYINFETVCAGDKYGLSGYPSFNGPLEVMDTLKGLGYDWFSTSSNHSMDAGSDGLLDEMNYIKDNLDGIVYTGTHTSEEEANEPTVIEVNGIRVGITGFTYGLNGYVKPDGMDWLVDVFMVDGKTVDYDLIDSRVNALMDVSDIQIVAIHWGEEYQNEPNEIQKEVASHLNALGVEVIIGCHPHVIQPVEIIKGTEQDTLCYYSLGNFLSAQDDNYKMVGGMADFDITYNFDTGETEFENVKFIPTVTWFSSDLRRYRTTTISEYTDEMAASHYITLVKGQDITKDWVNGYVAEVVGSPDGIEVVKA